MFIVCLAFCICLYYLSGVLLLCICRCAASLLRAFLLYSLCSFVASVVALVVVSDLCYHLGRSFKWRGRVASIWRLIICPYVLDSLGPPRSIFRFRPMLHVVTWSCAITSFWRANVRVEFVSNASHDQTHAPFCTLDFCVQEILACHHCQHELGSKHE